MYCINNVSPSKLGPSPIERWIGRTSNVHHFHIFGSTCYAHILDEHRNKLHPRDIKGIFIGFPMDKKGYKVFVPSLKKIIMTWDVVFIETEDQLLKLDSKAPTHRYNDD